METFFSVSLFCTFPVVLNGSFTFMMDSLWNEAHTIGKLESLPVFFAFFFRCYLLNKGQQFMKRKIKKKTW